MADTETIPMECFADFISPAGRVPTLAAIPHLPWMTMIAHSAALGYSRPLPSGLNGHPAQGPRLPGEFAEIESLPKAPGRPRCSGLIFMNVSHSESPSPLIR